MPRFRYRAHDVEGRAIEEQVEAASAYELSQALAAQGLTVTSVTSLPKRAPLLSSLRRLRWEDLRLFTQQLGSVVRSGYPLAPALKAMAGDLHRQRLRAVLEEMHDDVQRGLSLEEAIRRQHDRFPRVYGALIRAGEATGDLGGVLQLMTDHAARMTAALHRFKLAMMYPFILAISSTLVIGHLLLHTVPVFADVFSEMEATLPAPTRFLLFLSESFRAHWPLISSAIPLLGATLAGGYIAMRRTEDGRYITDWFKLYIPSIGPCYQGAVQARFCRTLSLLLAARVPIQDALTLAGAASGCAVLERGCERAARQVAQGERLTDALRNTRFFGPNFVWLLGTGEERGCAEESLENLAESIERETHARELAMGAYSAPMLTAIFGVIIGFFVVSMYLPIFTLGDHIGGGG